MGKSELPVAVADAGPIIHLDELGLLDLLGGFAGVILPEPVWTEVHRHRPALLVSSVPGARILSSPFRLSPQCMALADALALGLGERSALAAMETQPGSLLLCDDAAARLAAESLGYAVHGTIGIITRSVRTRRLTQSRALAILVDVPRRSTLHLSSKLLAEVIRLVESKPID